MIISRFSLLSSHSPAPHLHFHFYSQRRAVFGTYTYLALVLLQLWNGLHVQLSLYYSPLFLFLCPCPCLCRGPFLLFVLVEQLLVSLLSRVSLYPLFRPILPLPISSAVPRARKWALKFSFRSFLTSHPSIIHTESFFTSLFCLY